VQPAGDPEGMHVPDPAGWLAPLMKIAACVVAGDTYARDCNVRVSGALRAFGSEIVNVPDAVGAKCAVAGSTAAARGASTDVAPPEQPAMPAAKATAIAAGLMTCWGFIAGLRAIR